MTASAADSRHRPPTAAPAWRARAQRPAGLAAGALPAAGAAGMAAAVGGALRGRAPALERTNFRGRTVSLRGGLGAAAGSIAAAAACASRAPGAGGGAVALAALVSTTAAAGAGLVDDLDAGAHDGGRAAKGLKGHLGALARGHVTTGIIKIAVIGGGAAGAGALISGARAGARAAPGATAPGRLLDAAVCTVVVASWANVINLLDLRPGRALKAAGLGGSVLLALRGPRGRATRGLGAGTVAVAAACLPQDLAERTMLGDTGANALGALLGTALAAHPGPALRTGAGLAGVALILASERVSFSRIIEGTPVLARLDALGRRA